MCLLTLQRNQTGNQQWEGQQNTNKCMEIKQQATEWPMGHWRDSKRNKNFLEFNENENTSFSKPKEYSKSSLKREVDSIQYLQEHSLKWYILRA